jgi:hypothetical protein
METLGAWCAERGRRIAPSGLDIAPGLAALARRRLPRWAERIFVGNAIDWAPPRRFDFVRTGLEYVPPRRQRELVRRLLEAVVARHGRLIVGVYSEERDESRAGPSKRSARPIGGSGSRAASNGRTRATRAWCTAPSGSTSRAEPSGFEMLQPASSRARSSGPIPSTKPSKPLKRGLGGLRQVIGSTACRRPVLAGARVARRRCPTGEDVTGNPRGHERDY